MIEFGKTLRAAREAKGRTTKGNAFVKVIVL